MFDKHSKISSSAVVKRFKGWKNALEAADLAEYYSGRAVSTKMRKQRAKKMTDMELIDELRSVANKLNTTKLTMHDFTTHSSINSEAVRRRFGTWWVALQKAKLQISNLGKRYTDDDYFENMLSVWTHYGRQPKYKEMDSPPSFISSGAYEAKWGMWTNALKAFINRVNSDVHEKNEGIQKPLATTPLTSTISVKQPTSTRKIPLGLRYDVLMRDNFKCVLCGNSPAIDPKCKLHIDHVIPFSKQGSTNSQNLRTLCDKCNIGKSNKTKDTNKER